MKFIFNVICFLKTDKINRQNLSLNFLQKCLLTSLYSALFSLCAGEGVDEVSKGTMAAEELLVWTTLCDFSIYQDEDMVSLRQEAHPMGHQDAGLCSKPHKSEK